MNLLSTVNAFYKTQQHLQRKLIIYFATTLFGNVCFRMPLSIMKFKGDTERGRRRYSGTNITKMNAEGNRGTINLYQLCLSQNDHRETKKSNIRIKKHRLKKKLESSPVVHTSGNASGYDSQEPHEYFNKNEVSNQTKWCMKKISKALNKANKTPWKVIKKNIETKGKLTTLQRQLQRLSSKKKRSAYSEKQNNLKCYKLLKSWSECKRRTPFCQCCTACDEKENQKMCKILKGKNSMHQWPETWLRGTAV